LFQNPALPYNIRGGAGTPRKLDESASGDGGELDPLSVSFLAIEKHRNNPDQKNRSRPETRSGGEDRGLILNSLQKQFLSYP
jgi:hypothetical protein